MKKALFNLALVLGLVAAGLYYLIGSARPEVVVEPVRRDLALDAVSGNVRIFSASSLVLKSEAKGRVVATLAPPNSGPVPVAAGEVVVQLDQTDVLRERELVQIRLDAAERRMAAGSAFDSQVADAEFNLKLQEELAANDQFPQAELERTRRHLNSLKLQRTQEAIHREEEIAFLKNDLTRLDTALERLSVVSPMDGYVTAILSPVGDLVYDGASVARVISRDSIVEVSLSEEGFEGVELGQPVTVRLLSQGNRLFTGEVDVILAEADEHTKRRSVYVTLEADREVLVPGTTGQASITKAERADTLVVPRRALVGNAVFVVKGGEVVLRPVETGFVGLHRVEVLSGLSEGELVIVETPHLFRAGERVRVVD